MKALSIKEPWASHICKGKKTIETRTWKTNYRGEILLCASKKPASSMSGYAFAIAELFDIKLMTKEHEAKALCEVYPNAFSWFLRNVEPLEYPFKVKGSLGIFEVPDEKLKRCHNCNRPRLRDVAKKCRHCTFVKKRE